MNNRYVSRVKQPLPIFAASSLRRAGIHAPTCHIQAHFAGGFHKTAITAHCATLGLNAAVHLSRLISPDNHFPAIPLFQRIGFNTRLRANVSKFCIHYRRIFALEITADQRRAAAALPTDIHFGVASQGHART